MAKISAALLRHFLFEDFVIFYSRCFNMFLLLLPSKYSPFDKMHRHGRIFQRPKLYWNSCYGVLFNVSVVFFFAISTAANYVTLESVNEKDSDQVLTVILVHDTHLVVTPFDLP